MFYVLNYAYCLFLRTSVRCSAVEVIRCAVLRYAALCGAVLYRAVLCCAVLCCTVLCYAVFCCAVQRCAVLCGAALWGAALCRVVLCGAARRAVAWACAGLGSAYLSSRLVVMPIHSRAWIVPALSSVRELLRKRSPKLDIAVTPRPGPAFACAATERPITVAALQVS